MTPDQVRAGQALVRAMPGDVLVIGTFALVLHGVWPPEHAADVDVLTRIEDVPAIADVLWAHGYRVRVWQEPLQAPASLAQLRGRIYVRGDRDGLVMDVTYEELDLALWQSDAVPIGALRVASVERIVAAKRARNSPKDRHVLSLLATTASAG